MRKHTKTAVGFFSGQGNAAPTRELSLLALFGVGLMIVAACAVISDPLQRDVLDREWSTTADFIRTEAVGTLTAADFEAPETSGAQARFLTFYQRAVVMPEIISVKVYDATTRLVWSDKAQLVGQELRDNSSAERGLDRPHGRALRASQRERKRLRARSRPLVEIYVPIAFETGGRIVGVVEVYKRPRRN